MCSVAVEAQGLKGSTHPKLQNPRPLKTPNLEGLAAALLGESRRAGNELGSAKQAMLLHQPLHWLPLLAQ